MKKKRKAGQPTKLTHTMAAHIDMLSRRGFTDLEISQIKNISESTLTKWKQNPEFFTFLKRAKTQADGNVSRSLYERATGYTCDDVVVTNFQGCVTLTPIKKHYPPDVTAGIFWLKNRDSDSWKDRVVHAGDPNAPLGTITLPAPVAPGAPIPGYDKK